MLTCVDPASLSLHMINLHSEAEMTQIPLQVTFDSVELQLFLHLCCLDDRFCDVSSVLFSKFPLRNSFLQSLGLEVSPGFRPLLISSQPNPARQPLSEFFLQLGPERYLLLQLNNGQIVTLRDFNPVRTLCLLFSCFLSKHLSASPVTGC